MFMESVMEELQYRPRDIDLHPEECQGEEDCRHGLRYGERIIEI
jgi:hypothetical protein